MVRCPMTQIKNFPFASTLGCLSGDEFGLLQRPALGCLEIARSILGQCPLNLFWKRFA